MHLTVLSYLNQSVDSSSPHDMAPKVLAVVRMSERLTMVIMATIHTCNEVAFTIQTIILCLKPIFMYMKS